MFILTRHINSIGRAALYSLWVATDKNRHLVPTCLAICSDEQAYSFEFIFSTLQRHSNYPPSIVIMDASLAIRNTFRTVFGKQSTLFMCWAHMQKNVVKHLSHTSLKSREEIYQTLTTDNCLLTRKPSTKAFYYLRSGQNQNPTL